MQAEIKGWKPIFLAFKIFMAFVYLLMGVVILFFNKFLLPLNNSMRIAFGILLVVYGVFRIYTTIFKGKSDEKY
jgi:pilus assembly protein TadC